MPGWSGSMSMPFGNVPMGSPVGAGIQALLRIMGRKRSGGSGQSEAVDREGDRAMAELLGMDTSMQPPPSVVGPDSMPWLGGMSGAMNEGDMSSMSPRSGMPGMPGMPMPGMMAPMRSQTVPPQEGMAGSPRPIMGPGQIEQWAQELMRRRMMMSGGMGGMGLGQ
jgi:hypothetical protein